MSGHLGLAQPLGNGQPGQGGLPSAGDLPRGARKARKAAQKGALQPASWRSALNRPEAPGAELDSQPWARSWGHYLRAVLDPYDPSARQYIANVQDARRLKNAAWSERVPSEGAFLVPESLRSQVYAYMTRAIVRPQAMVLPMPTLRLGIPVVDNPSQASGAQALGGLTFSFTEEGQTIAATVPSFGKTVLEARKLAAMLLVPNELANDAAEAFGDFLARVIALGLAWVEDDYFIGTAGTGVGCPQSLINAPAAVAVSRASANNPAQLADVVAVLKALHPASRQAAMTPGATGTTWLLSADALDALLDMYLNVGGSTAPTDITPVALSDWYQAGDGRGVGASILGVPAVITDHQPASGSAGDIVLADLEHYAIGDRLEMTVERSAKGSGFGEDSSQFRIWVRLDGRYRIPAATTTEANQQVSPVVVLT